MSTIDWHREFRRDRPAYPPPPCGCPEEDESLRECSGCGASICDCNALHLDEDHAAAVRQVGKLLAALEDRGYMVLSKHYGSLQVIPSAQLTPENRWACERARLMLVRLLCEWRVLPAKQP